MTDVLKNAAAAMVAVVLATASMTAIVVVPSPDDTPAIAAVAAPELA